MPLAAIWWYSADVLWEESQRTNEHSWNSWKGNSSGKKSYCRWNRCVTDWKEKWFTSLRITQARYGISTDDRRMLGLETHNSELPFLAKTSWTSYHLAKWSRNRYCRPTNLSNQILNQVCKNAYIWCWGRDKYVRQDSMQWSVNVWMSTGCSQG